MLMTLRRRCTCQQNVHLCRRDVVVGEGQPTAGKSIKEQGSLVLIGPSPTPDTDFVDMNQHQEHAAGFLGL